MGHGPAGVGEEEGDTCEEAGGGPSPHQEVRMIALPLVMLSPRHQHAQAPPRALFHIGFSLAPQESSCSPWNWERRDLAPRVVPLLEIAVSGGGRPGLRGERPRAGLGRSCWGQGENLCLMSSALPTVGSPQGGLGVWSGEYGRKW